MKKHSICIVTPGYISSTPRVVKEADALAQAGFKVKVIFSQGHLEHIRLYDNELLKQKQWNWEAVCWSRFITSERFKYWRVTLRHKLFSQLPNRLLRLIEISKRAEGRIYPELARLAAKEKADLYIGHYPIGLAAAAYAAKKWHAKLGYDIEDLHTEEFSFLNKENFKKKNLIQLIETCYIPRCDHVTAVSDGVGKAIVDRYKIKKPTTVHNVFLLNDRQYLDNIYKDRKDLSIPSLYWFSQTIGEGRGIEDIIMAVGLLKHKIQIHLRGFLSHDIHAKFMALAKKHNVTDRLYFHDQVSPDELLSRAVEHDIGLALEQPVNLSRELSITNKFFFYLLAGLPVIATDVPGQRDVMNSFDTPVGMLYKPGDYHMLAEKLQMLILNPLQLSDYKRAALQISQSRCNWENESQILVKSIRSVIS